MSRTELVRTYKRVACSTTPGCRLQGKEGLRSKQLTASLVIEEKNFMLKRIKLVVVLIHDCARSPGSRPRCQDFY
eukprot:1148048-Pelagomonas_calceolata.AAC.14